MPVIKYVEELGCYMMLFEGDLFYIPAMADTGMPEMENNTFEWGEVTSVDGPDHMEIINKVFGLNLDHEKDFPGR